MDFIITTTYIQTIKINLFQKHIQATSYQKECSGRGEALARSKHTRHNSFKKGGSENTYLVGQRRHNKSTQTVQKTSFKATYPHSGIGSSK